MVCISGKAEVERFVERLFMSTNFESWIENLK